MENKLIFIEPLFERAEKFGKTSLELYKLKALNQSTKVISTLITKAIIFFIFLMFLILISVGGSLWLGDILGKNYYGFLCVSGFYGIIGLLIYVAFQNKIKACLSNSIINLMLN